jgi:hypothetical protein
MSQKIITGHPDKADSGNGRDQKLGFFFKEKTWDKYMASEDKALKSIDELLEKRPKIITSNQLVKVLGRSEAVKAIVNEVNNGNPPIVVLSNNSQFEMKFL